MNTPRVSPSSRGRVFDSSAGIQEVAAAIRELLTSQIDSIGILRIIVTEVHASKEMSKEFLVEIKNIVDTNQNILIGSAIDEVGGIKRDIKQIIEFLKAKTPWYLIVGAVGTLVGIAATLIGILIKMIELFKIIDNLPK